MYNDELNSKRTVSRFYRIQNIILRMYDSDYINEHQALLKLNYQNLIFDSYHFW